jgi:hypothetical protein
MRQKWVLGWTLTVLMGCAVTDEPLCVEGADADADGVADCDELEWGLDPTVADSDGDGYEDGEEIDCGTDPLDGEEACYDCGWLHNDPGDLEYTGDDVGDTIANLDLRDQCKDKVPLWDMAGEYHILFLTAVW